MHACIYALYLHIAGDNVHVKITALPDPQLELVCVDDQVVLMCDTVPHDVNDEIIVVYTWKFFVDGSQSEMEGSTLDVVTKETPVTYTCIASNSEIGIIATANFNLFSSG